MSSLDELVSKSMVRSYSASSKRGQSSAGEAFCPTAPTQPLAGVPDGRHVGDAHRVHGRLQGRHRVLGRGRSGRQHRDGDERSDSLHHGSPPRFLMICGERTAADATVRQVTKSVVLLGRDDQGNRAAAHRYTDARRPRRAGTAPGRRGSPELRSAHPTGRPPSQIHDGESADGVRRRAVRQGAGDSPEGTCGENTVADGCVRLDVERYAESGGTSPARPADASRGLIPRLRSVHGLAVLRHAAARERARRRPFGHEDVAVLVDGDALAGEAPAGCGPPRGRAAG